MARERGQIRDFIIATLSRWIILSPCNEEEKKLFSLQLN